MSAGDAKLTFFKVNSGQGRVDRENRLDFAPFERSSSADNPPEDVVRIFTFR